MTPLPSMVFDVFPLTNDLAVYAESLTLNTLSWLLSMKLLRLVKPL